MKTVLVIENEIQFIENAFAYVNQRHFQNKLNIEYVQKSQDIYPFEKIAEYDHVFLDISLAHHSQLDGFGILKKIQNESLYIRSLVILTGNHEISDGLRRRGLPEYPILVKPITFDQLIEVLK